jgi:hypothetical protein
MPEQIVDKILVICLVIMFAFGTIGLLQSYYQTRNKK